MIIFIFSKIIIMDISRNYHLEDKVEYIIALVNEERMIRLSGVKGIESGSRDCETGRSCMRRCSMRMRPPSLLFIRRSRSPKSVRMIMRTPICGLILGTCLCRGGGYADREAMKEIVPEFKSQHSKYEVLDK